ncbi:MAG: STAS/SEC14 domain-containing protein [Solirubrobacteraceae bacterium]
MIERLADMPPDTIGFRVTGEIEPGALWADAKLGFNLGIRQCEAWVRSAIATDIEWMARATKLFAWMIPGEARVFPLIELEQAKAWVADG